MERARNTPLPEVSLLLDGASRSCLKFMELIRLTKGMPDSREAGFPVVESKWIDVLLAVPLEVLTEAVRACWPDGVGKPIGNICQLLLLLEDEGDKLERMQLMLCHVLGRLQRCTAALGHSTTGFLSQFKQPASQCHNIKPLAMLFKVINLIFYTAVEPRKEKERKNEETGRPQVGGSKSAFRPHFDLDELLIWEGIVDQRLQTLYCHVKRAPSGSVTSYESELLLSLRGCICCIYQHIVAAVGEIREEAAAVETQLAASQMHKWAGRLASRWHTDRALPAQLKLLQLATLAEVSLMSASINRDSSQASQPEGVWKQLETLDSGCLLKVLGVLDDAVEASKNEVEDIAVSLNHIAKCLQFLLVAFSGFSSASKRWTMLLVCVVSKIVEPYTEPTWGRGLFSQDVSNVVESLKPLLGAVPHLARTIHMGYVYEHLHYGGSLPERGHPLEIELQMISKLVECYTLSADGSPLAVLFYWNLVTSIVCLATLERAGYFGESDRHPQSRFGLAMLQQLSKLTNNQFASVFMAIYTNARTVALEHRQPSVGTLCAFAMRLLNGDMLEPAGLLQGLKFFSDELLAVYQQGIAFSVTSPGNLERPHRHRTEWTLFIGALTTVVGAIHAFCKAAAARRLDKDTLSTAVCRLQALRKLLDGCTAWRCDGEAVCQFRVQGTDLIWVRDANSRFLASEENYRHSPPSCSAPSRSSIVETGDGLPVGMHTAGLESAAYVVDEAAAKDEQSIARHGSGGKYPPKAEKQLRGRNAERFGGD